MLTYSYFQTGAKALAGNVKLFKAVHYDRKITGNGKSIMCYDPEADETENLWEYENTSITDKLVPAGYEVRVIGGTVTFTKTTG